MVTVKSIETITNVNIDCTLKSKDMIPFAELHVHLKKAKKKHFK